MRGDAFTPVPNRGMITISIMLANIMQGLDNTILNPTWTAGRDFAIENGRNAGG